MESYQLCFLDLETTGHRPLEWDGEHLIPWNEIIDIGVVLADFKTLPPADCLENALEFCFDEHRRHHCTTVSRGPH